MTRSTGSSLLEVLVALSFVAVVGAITLAFARDCLRATEAQRSVSEALETAHLALGLMASEIRTAGYAEPDPLSTGLAIAQAAAIGLRSDLNGDGDTADANESVTYGSDEARGTVTRTSGAASPQPVVSQLAAGSLVFRYFDAAGLSLQPGSGGLDPASRARVRRIDVTFTIAVPRGDPHVQEAVHVPIATTIVLRNAPS